MSERVVVHIDLATVQRAINVARMARRKGFKIRRRGAELQILLPEHVTAGAVEREFRASIANGSISAGVTLTTINPEQPR